jgi:uroporphyrin-III C-methyltransferase/precorrin-2 dehydrogenase/sirohydrochlorin ferrochelatase
MKPRSKRPCEDGNPRGGRVTLVGAGPGDPELLTIKAVRAMQEADVILFDALVSEDVLAFARSTAKRMLVGKRGHRPSCNQDDINALMLKLAAQGKHVVRLKCGDCGLFGRAGEEIAHIEAAGFPVTVVPGITSASAMAASLNVSLTHRNCAQSVRFLTGHGKQGAMPENVDWTGLADSATTLVIYMGGRTAREIARRLIAEGLPKATPCVIATSVSLPQATRNFGTLGGLADGSLKTASDEPVLIGIGTVFADAARRALDAGPAETLHQPRYSEYNGQRA